MMQTPNNPPRLERQLTLHKTQYANQILDRLDNPSGSYMIELYAQNLDYFSSEEERDWFVHYIFVYNDGERELRAESIRGTYQYVKSLFKNDLMVR